MPLQNWTAIGDEYNLQIYQWGPAASGDTFVPVGRGDLVDRSIQVEGTFGAGGQISLQGSNDGVNYHTLHDPFNNQIIITSTSIVQVTEVTAWMKPLLNGGDGSTSLTITICVRRSFR